MFAGFRRFWIARRLEQTGFPRLGTKRMTNTNVIEANTESKSFNGVSYPVSRWDFDEGEAPPAIPAPWGPQEAAAAFKRLAGKYGPKDILTVIPPNAETADNLKDSKGKTPGYLK